MVEGVGGPSSAGRPGPTPHPDAAAVKKTISNNRDQLGISGETQGRVLVQIQGGQAKITFPEQSGWQKDSKTDAKTQANILNNLPGLLKEAGVRNGTLTITIRTGVDIKTT
jgi:hypothetical protein